MLYHSRSLCARCSFIDRSGFSLRPSVVFAAEAAELNGLLPATLALLRATLTTVNPTSSVSSPSSAHSSTAAVYLGVCCPVHPAEPFVLLCSSLSFFIRQWTYDHPPSLTSSSTSTSSSSALPPSAVSSLVTRSLDLEDLASATQYRLRSNVRSLPLLLELSLYREGEWMSNVEVDGELAAFASHFPPHHQFVLKVNGGLIERKADMEVLNQHIQRIVALTTPPLPPSQSGAAATSSAPPPPSAFPPALLPRLLNLPIVVDLTFDRLTDLSLLPSSVLLRANVVPCVRYFLSSTANETFIADLSSLLNALHTITDISLLLILTVDDPPPSDLQVILDFVQTQHRIIRMVVLTRERSSSLIFQSLMNTPPSTSTSSSSSSPLRPPMCFRC